MLKSNKQFSIPRLDSASFNKSVRNLFDRVSNIFSVGEEASASQQEVNTILDSSISTVEGETSRLRSIIESLKGADRSRLHSVYHITDNPGSFIDKNPDLYDGKPMASGHDPTLGNVISLPTQFSRSRVKGPFGNILASVQVAKTSGYHPSAGYKIERCIDTKTDTIWYEVAIGSMPITNIPRWVYHKDRWRQATEPYVGQGDPLSLKYSCPACSFVYDPEKGVGDNGDIVPLGTLWEDVPAVLLARYPNLDPQVCPRCFQGGVTTHLDRFIPYDYDPIYTIGPCMQVDIGFDIETVFNQVVINPFSIYPMRIADIRTVDMEGNSESIIKNGVPWIDIDGPTIISVGDYYDRDEVYAKKIELVLNQPHYTYGMSDSTKAQQHLSKLLSLLVTSDDVKRFTAPMAFRDIRNLSEKEAMFQELAGSIVEESANFSNEAGENLVMAAERVLAEYIDGSTIDSRFQFEYLYGFRELDVRYVEYARQARYVSLPITIKQSPMSMTIDVDSSVTRNHDIKAYITSRSGTSVGYTKRIVLGEPLYIKRAVIDDDLSLPTIEPEIIGNADIYNVDTTAVKVTDRLTDIVNLKAPVFIDWYTINSRHHGHFEPNSGIITEVPVIGQEVKDDVTGGIWSVSNISTSADLIVLPPQLDVFLHILSTSPDIINKMRVRPFYILKSNGDKVNIRQYKVYGGTTSNLEELKGSSVIDLPSTAGEEVNIEMPDYLDFAGKAWWEDTLEDGGIMDPLNDYGYFTHSSAEHAIQYWYMVSGILYQDSSGLLYATDTGGLTQIETDAVWIKAPMLPRGYDGPALNNTITYHSPHPLSVSVALDDGTLMRQNRSRGSILTTSYVQKGGVDGSDEAQLITELLALHDKQSYAIEGWHMVDLMPDPDYLQDGIQTRYISGDKNWDTGKPVVLFFDVDPPIDIDGNLSPEGSVWLIQQWLDNYTDGTLTVKDVYQNEQLTNAILHTVYFSSINMDSNNSSGDPSGTKRYDIDHSAGAVNINPGWARHYGINGTYNIKAIYWHQPDISVSTDGSIMALVDVPTGCINRTNYYSLEQPVLRPYDKSSYPIIEYLHINNSILFAQPIDGIIEVSYQTLLPTFRIIIDMETKETNGSTPTINSATLTVQSSPAMMRAINVNKV